MVGYLQGRLVSRPCPLLSPERDHRPDARGASSRQPRGDIADQEQISDGRLLLRTQNQVPAIGKK